jgi:hypothetical protein
MRVRAQRSTLSPAARSQRYKGVIADRVGLQLCYLLPPACYVYVLFHSIGGSRMPTRENPLLSLRPTLLLSHGIDPPYPDIDHLQHRRRRCLLITRLDGLEHGRVTVDSDCVIARIVDG